MPSGAQVIPQVGQAYRMAEAVRFELTKVLPLPVFKTGALNRSAKLPNGALGWDRTNFAEAPVLQTGDLPLDHLTRKVVRDGGVEPPLLGSRPRGLP